MAHPGDININAYDYDLPEERIASRPAERREDARLLVYRAGQIGQSVFRELPRQLPEGALLLFNNTRVVQARLPFRRPSGARIEIFCLEPVRPVEHQGSLSSQRPVVWSCLVGNNRRWKEVELERRIDHAGRTLHLSARRLGRRKEAFDIEFSWDDPELTFAQVLDLAGKTPLPPYIKRPGEAADRDRYQTVYAKRDGSVAAPTAGLHFTPALLDELDRRGFERQYLTLHVGAGTFLPVKSDRLEEHAMHQEKVSIPKEVIEALYQAIAQGRPVVPVGTTSMRVLESLFWFGQYLGNKDAPARMQIGQWDPYQSPPERTAREALSLILENLQATNRTELEGATRLLIAPGYRFQLASGLITNFHQPRSTLLLLIAALIGPDWRKIYAYALDHGFRFLSYGDSCLLLPKL